MPLFHKPDGASDQQPHVFRLRDAFQRALGTHSELIGYNKWWRLMGYLAVLPILAAVLLLTFGLQRLVDTLTLMDGMLVLALSIVALVWGAGPTLLLLLLGMVALDVFFIPPAGQLSLVKWPNMVQVVPFALAGVTISALSRLRERGWSQTRALAAANEQLEEEAQLKERFVSVTAHELRTPVAAIRLLTQSLQRRSNRSAARGDPGEQMQALAKIEERTRVLSSMIDELQDLARTQHQTSADQRESCDLGELCQQVVQEQRLLSGRTVLWQASATPALVWGDGRRLAQVVSNLLTNALKYSEPPAPVEVGVDQDGQQVLVWVRDQGQGIAADQLAHIFEPFYRTQEATASVTAGLGLGLAISQRIVDGHGGRLWCDSKPGHGSTFWMTLPMQAEVPPSPSLPHNSIPA